MTAISTQIKTLTSALAIVVVALFAASPAAASAGGEPAVEDRGRTAIVGGYYPYEPWPWMASLQNPRGAGNDLQQHICGGVLVHSRLVLTAAHCVLKNDGSRSFEDGAAEVVLGKTQLSAAGGESIVVSHVVVHPEYSLSTHRFDLALLFLAGHSAQPPAAILPPSVQLHEGNLARVMGWGRINSGGGAAQVDDRLRGLDMAIWSDQNCLGGGTDTNRKTFSAKFDPATMICAAYRSDSPDSICNGDSGGPMMVHDAEGNWYLTGLVSWGIKGCPGYGTPNVFTWLQNPSMSQMIQRGMGEAEAGLHMGGGSATPAPAPWMRASISHRRARVGKRVSLSVEGSGYSQVRVVTKRGGRRVDTDTFAIGSAGLRIRLWTRTRPGKLRYVVTGLTATGAASAGQELALRLRRR